MVILIKYFVNSISLIEYLPFLTFVSLQMKKVELRRVLVRERRMRVMMVRRGPRERTRTCLESPSMARMTVRGMMMRQKLKNCHIRNPQLPHL